jgi:hypothetical protein
LASAAPNPDERLEDDEDDDDEEEDEGVGTRGRLR